MELKKIIQKTIKIILPLILGFILLWYLYRKQNFGEMMDAIKNGVRYDILLFSLIFGLCANIARGLRWGMLIDSLGKPVRRKNVVFAVLGNYAVNMALPRVGEIWRCGITSKYEKIPFSKLLGTLFVDRITDTFVVGTLTLCLCVFNISFFRGFFAENPPVMVSMFYSFISSPWTYIILVLVAVAIWLLFFKMKHLAFVKKIRSLIAEVWEGFKSLWKMEHKVKFIIYTLLIWGGYFLYFYTTFFAFDFTKDLGVRIGLIAFAMSSIGVSVPVQGGIGVWHAMVITTFVTFGVNKTEASAFALVVYTIQSIWVVLVGLFGIFALPIVNKEKNENIINDKQDIIND